MTEAYKPTVTQAPRPSTINRGDLSSGLNRSRNLSPRQIGARLVLAATLIGGGRIAMDTQTTVGQEPSAAPSIGASFEPSPSAVATDPLTGLPCVPGTQPTPEPSESIIPDRTLPPDIGMVPGGEALALTGADVFVSAEAQAEPSTVPSEAPSTAPESPSPTDPTTAVNCDPVLTEAYIKAGKPEDNELVKFSFMDEAIEAPVSMGELKGIIKAFYAKYPEALEYTDEYDTKLTNKDRNKVLKLCEKGYPGDPKPVIQQSRANSCAGLIRDFYEMAMHNKSQGMMDLAQSVYWYALASLKTPDPAYTIGEFLRGIEIKNQVIQG